MRYYPKMVGRDQSGAEISHNGCNFTIRYVNNFKGYSSLVDIMDIKWIQTTMPLQKLRSMLGKMNSFPENSRMRQKLQQRFYKHL